jgi:peptidyl-prolyl cis-trans isomerase SurA
MYFLGKLKTLIIASLFIIFNIQNSNTIENKILFKIDNEIITTIDIYEEIKFLRTFTPEINDLEVAELYEISKNSILRDRIKKIEILEFVKELKVQDKFLLNLIKNKYSKTNIDTLEDFRIYLKKNNLDFNNISEKLTIELIWNDLIYQKFIKKVSIDREKIKKELLQNSKKKIQREFLLSEIVFTENDKINSKKKNEEIILDINNIGFKKTALKHSVSDTASNGGLIGWIKEDNLNQNIKKIVNELKTGQFSKPIRTSSGFMILKINDEKEYLSKFNLADKMEEVIRFKTNDQLNQFSRMYFNKVKKDLIIYGL